MSLTVCLGAVVFAITLEKLVYSFFASYVSYALTLLQLRLLAILPDLESEIY